MSRVTLKYSGLGPVSMPAGKTVGGIITIKPGISELSADQWEKMKVQPDIKLMLERGEKHGAEAAEHDKKTGLGNIVVISDGKAEKSDNADGESKSGTENKSGNVPGNQNDAKKLVGETEDTTLLNSWLEKDTRAGVKNSIEKKLQEIEAYRLEHGDKKD